MDEERALHSNCPNIDTLLRGWIKTRAAERKHEPFDCGDYEAFCDSTEELTSLAADNPRALVQRFIDISLCEHFQVQLELYRRQEDMRNQLGGPCFRCDMLVDTTCEEQCDWGKIFSDPYEFNALADMAYGEVFVCDVNIESTRDAIRVAKFMRDSSHECNNTETAATEEGWCSMPGCSLPFPPPPDSHAKNGFSFTYRAPRRGVSWKAKCLCNTHYQRLDELRAK